MGGQAHSPRVARWRWWLASPAPARLPSNTMRDALLSPRHLLQVQLELLAGAGATPGAGCCGGVGLRPASRRALALRPRLYPRGERARVCVRRWQWAGVGKRAGVVTPAGRSVRQRALLDACGRAVLARVADAKQRRPIIRVRVHKHPLRLWVSVCVCTGASVGEEQRQQQQAATPTPHARTCVTAPHVVALTLCPRRASACNHAAAAAAEPWSARPPSLSALPSRTPAPRKHRTCRARAS